MTWTALHELFATRPTPFANASIIKEARQAPEAIISVDDRGYTPLHIAVTNNDPQLEAIRALVNVYPNVVMAKDLHGDTPMHLALRPNAKVELIRILLQACPKVAFESNKEGLMPLHAASRYCCNNVDIIALLIEANPHALKSRTKMGSLVQKKKKVAPALVPNKNFAMNNQHLALDGTTSSSWKSSQIKTSSEAQFEERSRQLREGSFPLHMAIANGAPLAVIEMLIKAAPDVIFLTDKFERTCLHLAVANGATKDYAVSVDPVTLEEVKFEQQPRITISVIELLHSIDKKLISRQDKSKNLPLHTATQGGCSIRCANFLIQAYPHARSEKNKDGMAPYEIASVSGNCDKDVLNLLN